MRKIITLLLLLFFIPVVFSASLFPSTIKNARDYSFVVAGHSYGCRPEAEDCIPSLGLYPKFLSALEKNKENINFLILTGDISRTSSEESWQQIKQELQETGLPYYLVLGNHDDLTVNGQNVLIEKYGNTYYQFDVGFERFIMLDSQKDGHRISTDQLQFLKESLDNSTGIKTVFIFFHELLWNSDEKYAGIRANKGSRTADMQNANYWSAVQPLLEQYPQKNFYIIAGDVGANADGIAAFHQNLGNIKFIASGMGGLPDENYLLVTVKGNDLSLKLVPLNEKEIHLEDYTLEKLSDHSLWDRIRFLYIRLKEYINNKIGSGY